MDIIMAGYAGRCGAQALALSRRKDLEQELPSGIVNLAARPGPYLAIPDSVPVFSRSRLGAGGVLRGLWILAEKLQCGFDVDLRRVLLRQEDVEICEILGEDIYGIDASGGWLIAVRTAEAAMQILRKEQIPAGVIGTCSANRVRALHMGEAVRYLEGV